MMSKKILAFGGSTSSTSINKQLATYASSLLKEAIAEVIDLRDYDASLFSVDAEKNGFPQNLVDLSSQMKTYDGFIISLAEHNGSYAAAFKNTLDWLSRIERKIFNDKPVLLMAASPGGRGGATVLAGAKTYFPYMGANIVADFSLPGFFDNFKEGKIVNEDFNNQLVDKVSQFESNL